MMLLTAATHLLYTFYIVNMERTLWGHSCALYVRSHGKSSPCVVQCVCPSVCLSVCVFVRACYIGITQRSVNDIFSCARSCIVQAASPLHSYIFISLCIIHLLCGPSAGDRSTSCTPYMRSPGRRNPCPNPRENIFKSF